MTVSIINASMAECHDLGGHTIVYCVLNDELHVIAKSIVKLLVETDYICGENPYILRTIETLPNDTVLLPVSGEKLLRKIWDNPGDRKDVYFVKVKALINHLEEIFPDVEQRLLHRLRQAMQSHIQAGN